MSLETSLMPHECTWAGMMDDETHEPSVSVAPGGSQPMPDVRGHPRPPSLR